MGMASAVFTPAIVARRIGVPLAEALTNADVAAASATYRMAMEVGAVTRTVNSVIESVVQRRSLGDAAWDALQAPAKGAIGGALGVAWGRWSGGGVAARPAAGDRREMARLLG
jgi:hypothetical protein